jgi:hypothetical protein
VAGGLSVASVWIGVALSYEVPALPPSSAIIGVAAGIYGLSFARSVGRRGRPAGRSPPRRARGPGGEDAGGRHRRFVR